MKKILKTSLAISLFFIVFICSGCTTKKSGAANLFNFNNKEVLVTLDLKDGWYVEFGENGTYLYDQIPDNKTDAVAYGVYVSKEDYENDLDGYKKSKGYKEIENGIYFEEDTLSKYIISIDDNIYYEIIIHKNANYNPDKVFKRFKVELNVM